MKFETQRIVSLIKNKRHGIRLVPSFLKLRGSESKEMMSCFKKIKAVVKEIASVTKEMPSVDKL